MDFVDFKADHLNKIKAKDIFSGEDIGDRLVEIACMENSYATTLMRWDRVVAIFGTVRLWPGVSDSWAVTSDLTHEHPLAFHKAVLSVINEYREKLQLHRMQLTVNAGYPMGIRWAGCLGFTNEGLMKQYGQDKSNHIRFARTW